MKGVAKIKGALNPKIGEATFYEVVEFHKGTVVIDPNTIKWKLYQFKDGKWDELSGPVKTGKKVSYNFPQKWYTKKLLIEAYIFEAEAKSPPGIIVKPCMGERKINSTEILNAEGKPIAQMPKYGQSIILRATTENMLGEVLKLSVWERDTYSDKGHDPNGNQLLWSGNSKKVNNKGFGEQKILLSPDMMMKAGKSMFDGSEHEYYLLVEADKIKTMSATTQVSSEIVLSPGNHQVAKKDPVPAKETSLIDQAIVKIKNAVGWDKITVEGITNAVIDMVTPVEKKEDEKSNCPRCKEDFKYDDVVKVFPAAANNKDLAEKLIVEINKLKVKYEVNTCIRKAHLINQLGSETGFHTLIEGIDGYSVKTLKSLFGYFKRHPEEAETYKGNLYEIAVRAYGLRKVDEEKDIVACNVKPGGKCNDLGNETKEDGYTYIGRGLIQLTGKYNYSQINIAFKKAFPDKGDLVTNPELLEEPEYAALSAFSYWINNKLNAKADLGDKPSNVDELTKIINKNLDESHYEKRRKSFLKAKEVYRLSECKNLKTSETGNVVIRLIRKWETDKSTTGEFTIDNSTITGYILEEKGPDTKTAGLEQRVPIGTYNLVSHSGTKFKKVLKLYNSDVSIDRAILIHPGNSADDTEGCLLPGTTRSKDWVSSSGNKLKEILEHVNSTGIENAKIIITEKYE